MKKIQTIHSVLFCLLLALISGFGYATSESINVQCYLSLMNNPNLESIRGTRLDADIKTVIEEHVTPRDIPRYPTHFNLRTDQRLEFEWNQRPDRPHPSLLRKVLPKDVYFLKNHLQYTHHPTSVRFGINDWRHLLYGRAHWTYRGQSIASNILFSRHAIDDNIQRLNSKNTNKKWLVGARAKAAVLYLHGGGTKTTGGFVAVPVLHAFAHYGIDVISIDSNFHAGGPRNFTGSVRDFILSLGEFLTKFIPPDKPVFIMGHSFGGFWAKEAREIAYQLQKEDKIPLHPNLKGVIILSPPIDAKPGSDPKEKSDAFRKITESNELDPTIKERTPETERNVLDLLLREDKLSPIGSAYEYATLHQVDQTLSAEIISNPIPGLMIVGKGDPTVYLGFEKQFHDHYDPIENIQTKFLDPTFNRETQQHIPVGHLLDNWQLSKNSAQPIHFALSIQFIGEQLGLTAEELKVNNRRNITQHPIVSLAVEYANSLSFRHWLRNLNIVRLESSSNELLKQNGDISQLQKQIPEIIHTHHADSRIIQILKNLSVYQTKEEFDSLFLDLLAAKDLAIPSKHNQEFISLIERLQQKWKSSELTPELARKIIRNTLYIPRYLEIVSHPQHSILTNSLENSNLEEVANLFNQFPYSSPPSSTEDRLFILPKQVKERLLDLHQQYQNTSPQFLKKKLRNSVNAIAKTHHPKMIFYRLLRQIIDLSGQPRTPETVQALLTKKQIYFSNLPNYRDLEKDLSKLIQLYSSHEGLEVSEVIKMHIRRFIDLYHVPHKINNHHDMPSINRMVSKEDLEGDSDTLWNLLNEKLNEMKFPSESIDAIHRQFQKLESKKSILNTIAQMHPENQVLQLIDILQYELASTILFSVRSFLNTSLANEKIDWSALLDSSNPQRRVRVAELTLQLFLRIMPSSHQNNLLGFLEREAKRNQFESLHNSPFTTEIKEKLKKLLEEKVKIESIAEEVHIPTNRNFYEYTNVDSSLSQDQKHETIIKEIISIAEELQTLKTQHNILTEQINGINKSIKKSDKIERAKSLINDFLLQQEIDPHEVLKSIHQKVVAPVLEKLRTDFFIAESKIGADMGNLIHLKTNKNPHYQIGQSIEIHPNELKQVIDNKQIQNYNQSSVEWQKKTRKKFHRLILQALSEGRLGEEWKKRVNSLISIREIANQQLEIQYDGIEYKNKEFLQLELAQKEAEIRTVNNRIALLKARYHELHPSPALYTSRHIDHTLLNPDLPKKNLTPSKVALQYNQYLTENLPSIAEILSQWKKSHSQLPPHIDF